MGTGAGRDMTQRARAFGQTAGDRQVKSGDGGERCRESVAA